MLVRNRRIESAELGRNREHHPMRRIQLPELPLPFGCLIASSANDHDLRRLQILRQRLQHAHMPMRIAIEGQPPGTQGAFGRL